RGESVSVILPRGSQVSYEGVRTLSLFDPIMFEPRSRGLAERIVRKLKRLYVKWGRRRTYKNLFLTGNKDTFFLLHTVSMEEVEIALGAFASASRRKSIGRLKVVVRADHNDDALRI